MSEPSDPDPSSRDPNIPAFRPPTRREPAPVDASSGEPAIAPNPAEPPATPDATASVSQSAFSLDGVPRAPMFAGGFALLTAFGTTQTWMRVLFVSIDGLETDRGVLTLLATLGVAGLSAWRIFSTIRERTYVYIGVPLAILGFTMPLWFLIDISNSGDASSSIAASGGLWLTIIAASGMLAAIGWHARKWLPAHSE